MIKEPASLIVPALTKSLQDVNDYICFTAGIALTRIGKSAFAAVPALEKALTDNNRYVRGIAVDALSYIRTDEALDVLLPYLNNARLCPLTNPKSAY